ncbi:hypothetical protein JRQ81_012004 [Phrynocephalus forsythii]|uniref:NADH dehydrogenase [ubiquinone] iron-sulfur protein 5 n=1 Tax=Phrynocephalus forsythii TaxID=171643 RepID=A0A9Q0X7S0_9SAUR|nr:hypothetical protein JRQ81_012004 [Phrynocephalus forsythii]
MPFLELQKQLGINVDQWNINLSSKQPYHHAPKCHVFEKQWLECSDGIGEIRAKEECRLEREDLEECMLMLKMFKRLNTINEHKRKLIKEGKYTPPEHHHQ